MTRLVSAEEARGLLEGSTPGPWVANLDDDKRAASRNWRVVDTGVRLVVGADWYERHSAGETETVCGVKIAKVDAALIAAAPDLAATVIALSEERDRLRDILACERGEKAPEGWTRMSKFSHDWENQRTGMCVNNLTPGEWQAFQWSLQADLPVGDKQPTALEAIEAADRAATSK